MFHLSHSDGEIRHNNNIENCLFSWKLRRQSLWGRAQDLIEINILYA